ncbi:hypothetical protein J4731_02225 [Providencia rettgeri]|nr:hypothetical protein [Providencia rettgeri]
MKKVIEVNQLVKTFGQPRGLFHPRGRQVHALKIFHYRSMKVKPLLL